jgi:transposase-like protein
MTRPACPTCHCSEKIRLHGSFTRKLDRRRVCRYFCVACAESFSDQTKRLDYRHRKPWINQSVFSLLCKGTSQRGAALFLGVRPATIARRVVQFGNVAKKNLEDYRNSRAKADPVSNIVFDEMESFEHTKCKPLTIPLAVEEKTRKILALGVGSIPAKGPLAAISLKKYGPRRCDRRRLLKQLFTDLKTCCTTNASFSSDESVHYPKALRKLFPKASHRRFKGRKGCVVGQGELKSGRYDPLFSLNHTCAMVRDNIKRMSRRTWCTTKRPDRLENLLCLYAWFHNLIIDNFVKPKLTIADPH